jgi:hypothetical protein
VIGRTVLEIPIEELRLVARCWRFPWRGCDWSHSAGDSYKGVVIGRTVLEIPIEGL